MKSFFDPAMWHEIETRLRALQPDTVRRWGTMNAPRMIAHLTDQMHHCLGDYPCRPVPGLIRNPVGRYLGIYLLPWPHGRVKGPPDAFLRKPGDWKSDIGELIALVHRFGNENPDKSWPEHARFGPMRGADWGYFCYKHFNHHLSQFGV